MCVCDWYGVGEKGWEIFVVVLFYVLYVLHVQNEKLIKRFWLKKIAKVLVRQPWSIKSCFSNQLSIDSWKITNKYNKEWCSTRSPTPLRWRGLTSVNFIICNCWQTFAQFLLSYWLPVQLYDLVDCTHLHAQRLNSTSKSDVKGATVVKFSHSDIRSFWVNAQLRHFWKSNEQSDSLCPKLAIFTKIKSEVHCSQKCQIFVTTTQHIDKFY